MKRATILPVYGLSDDRPELSVEVTPGGPFESFDFVEQALEWAAANADVVTFGHEDWAPDDPRVAVAAADWRRVITRFEEEYEKEYDEPQLWYTAWLGDDGEVTIFHVSARTIDEALGRGTDEGYSGEFDIGLARYDAEHRFVA